MAVKRSSALLSVKTNKQTQQKFPPSPLGGLEVGERHGMICDLELLKLADGEQTNHVTADIVFSGECPDPSSVWNSFGFAHDGFLQRMPAVQFRM